MNFRTFAKNDFEKNLYKLMNNAVFNKPWRACAITSMCDSWRNRKTDTMRKHCKTKFSQSKFSENLVTIELRKLKVKFNKPIYMDICRSSTYPTHFVWISSCHRCIVRNIKLYTLIRTVLFTISSATCDVWNHEARH